MRRQRQRSQGFTLIEVMVSLGIMTIGAMAVLALQQQIIRGNVHARQITMATQIAQNVIERLKIDSISWIAPGVPTGAYLRNVAPGAIGAFQTLRFITTTSGGVTRLQSNAFDYYGDDLNTQNGSPVGLFYCASYRLSFVYTNNRIIRADVRVWWAREGQAGIRADFPTCDDDNAKLNPGGTAIDNYHVVYLSTVIRAAN
jgi:prepilin-type N-terminal cleavage/methylation domain-containing protein